MTKFLLAILISYLAGAIPFGLFVAKFCGNIDIRKFGSGNIGATNVGRAMGFKWFLVVFLLDLLKGLLPVFLIQWLMYPENPSYENHVAVLCGLAAVVGHTWPIWLKFKGGKGVATGLGTVIVLGPQASLVAGIVFLLSLGIFRMVSLSSILAAITFSVIQIMLLLPDPFSATSYSLALFAIVVPALIIYSHRGNIKRIWSGDEHKIGKKSLNKS